MGWRVEVFKKKGIISFEAEKVRRELGSFGFRDVEVEFRRVYLLDIPVFFTRLKEVVAEVLVDRVTESYLLFDSFSGEKPQREEIEIGYRRGVMDEVSLTVERAIRELGIEVRGVRTLRKYRFKGLEREEIENIASKILYNPLIEYVVEYERLRKVRSLQEFMNVAYKFKLREIDLLNADDGKLRSISREGSLALNLQEMKEIKKYFSRKKRNPTDCELETLAQTWSEHCYHKTFRGIIEYEEQDEKGRILKKERIVNLLKSTIMRATSELKKSFCVSVFEDNSGIIRFDESFNICFKVETHNHPSSLEPYGGSSTGIGGVIRDILGTGRGAYPVANTDVFCFGLPDISYQELPQGVLHPRRIIRGVVSGVRDYGNKMGIPTVCGAVFFDERFSGNPLVYCGTVGILPEDKSFKSLKPADLIIVCGGKTGKDGIHGATFSSLELDTSSSDISSSAVQIGNPIEEKKLTQALIQARDKNLYTAVTDCGAGGLSSAIGELTKEYGARVYLERVPLKYKGLSYVEIWISESQERMVLIVPPEKIKELEEIFQEEEVEYSIIGEVTSSKRLELFYEGNKVCDLEMEFLHGGIPPLIRKAVWVNKKESLVRPPVPSSSEILKSLLSSYNICSREWIIRQYDHEVQGSSVIKPLMEKNSAPQDAAVIRPLLNSMKAIALGCGINPFYSDIDPYWMAGLAIDEALRNIICVGASLKKAVLLDNFSWGSPEDEKNLGALVRAAQACYEFSRGLEVPFISGKDSLYNEYIDKDKKKRIVIPHTLLISSLGIIEDLRRCITSSFKKEGSLIYIVGLTKEELGASEYFRLLKVKGGAVPKPDITLSRKIYQRIEEAIQAGLVISCHDCSEGGLGVSLAEMCFGNFLGAEIFLEEVPYEEDLREDFILFSESPSRFIVEVEKDNKDKFEHLLQDCPSGLIGCVSSSNRLKIYGRKSRLIIQEEVETLFDLWRSSLGALWAEE